jgi:hypothetical protein
MAVTDGPYPYAYNTTVTTGTSTSWTLPLTISNGSYVYSGSAGGVSAPRPQTALEWLDAEIEATCRLARQAA